MSEVPVCIGQVCSGQSWYNLKKLKEVEGKERYHIEISNRFAALENLDSEMDVNKAWETIRENIKKIGRAHV
jgi:phosphomevalonate kinase